MKKIILLLAALMLTTHLIAEEVMIEPELLTMETFKEKIFDYENSEKWNYIGELPAIIDFYADWCGPCKQIAPIMVELANEYDGKVLIYKVDTDAERQLAGMFWIESIPSILFIPVGEQPQMVTGALPKESFVKIIEEVLKVQ